MLDYRIDTFLTLCECMNYRKTAEILHISQPAVTQQIHYLENQYGQKLFEYENRRLVKTEAAAVLEKYARAAKLQEKDLREKLENKPIHSLRIGATKTIGDYYLKGHIRRYLTSPDNALTLLVDNTERLLRLLEENALDFAVVEGFFDKTRFDNILLRREPFVGICRRDHPFAGREVTIDELLPPGGRFRHPGDSGAGTAGLQRIPAAVSAPYLHFQLQYHSGFGEAGLRRVLRIQHPCRLRPGTGEILHSGRKRCPGIQRGVSQIRGYERENQIVLQKSVGQGSSPCPAKVHFVFSSSGIKSSVISLRLVHSWMYFTPAESIIRLEASVDMESAYLSDK